MISVCMATHNGEKYIKEQLESILKQIGSGDEIIISDDTSTDRTLEIISDLNDSRIIVLNHTKKTVLPPHEYATLNFENAIKHAKGDYIFLSDQDDVWADNKVSISIKYLQQYDYIVSDAYVTDSQLNVIHKTRFLPEEHIHFNKYLAVFLSTPYQGSCAAFRRSLLKKILPFPKGLQSHDRWIGNVAAFYFNSKIIPEQLIYYRRHESTTSNTFSSQKIKINYLRSIRYKLIYALGLITRIKK